MKQDTTPHGTKGNLAYWVKNRKKIQDLYKSERKFFLKYLKKSNSFLDIGCAAGNFVKIIKSYKKNFIYLGLDISKNLISLARKRNPNHHFKITNGSDLGYLNKKFNLVFSFGTLHHSRYYLRLINEMLKASDKYVLFDLRLVNTKSTNSKSQYQQMEFAKFKEEKTAVRYITLNKKRIIKQIIDLTKKKYEINIYGYSNKVSKTYVGNHKKVWMTAFLIDKTKPYKIKKDISL